MTGLATAARVLAAHAEIVLGNLTAAEAEIAALRGGGRGTVRLASFASAARTLVPAVWRQLGDESPLGPTVSLQLIEQEPEPALESLRRSRVDLALVHGYTVLPREFPPGCEHAMLLRDPVVAVLSPEASPSSGPGGAGAARRCAPGGRAVAYSR